MECLDALSELVYHGKYKKKFEILDLKSAIMSSPRANSPQKILTEWKHQTHTVQVRDKDFVVADDLKVTLLHRIMPQALQDTMERVRNSFVQQGTTTGANKIYMASLWMRWMGEEATNTQGVHSLCGSECHDKSLVAHTLDENDQDIH